MEASGLAILPLSAGLCAAILEPSALIRSATHHTWRALVAARVELLVYVRLEPYFGGRTFLTLGPGHAVEQTQFVFRTISRSARWALEPPAEASEPLMSVHFSKVRCYASKWCRIPERLTRYQKHRGRESRGGDVFFGAAVLSIRRVEGSPSGLAQ